VENSENEYSQNPLTNENGRFRPILSRKFPKIRPAPLQALWKTLWKMWRIFILGRFIHTFLRRKKRILHRATWYFLHIIRTN